MKSIILAAGYATRLYPLTKDKPKPLLDVKDKPIIEHIINKIDQIDIIDEIFIVTNNKFFTNFLEWASDFESKTKITIVNDRTKSNNDRLGSLGDIKYVVENMDVTEDILVIAGDNLFEFSLKEIVNLYKGKNLPVVALYDVKDIELAKLYGVVSIDKENKITHFQEKPENPESTLASTGIYIYPEDAVKKLIEFVNTHDADKAGDFLEWLHEKEDIYCYVTDKNWFDIGSLDQLEKARDKFRG